MTVETYEMKKYIAFDGMEFTSEEECLLYEQKEKFIKYAPLNIRNRTVYLVRTSRQTYRSMENEIFSTEEMALDSVRNMEAGSYVIDEYIIDERYFKELYRICKNAIEERASGIK